MLTIPALLVFGAERYYSIAIFSPFEPETVAVQRPRFRLRQDPIDSGGDRGGG
jgi:hypothetical protein